MNALKSELLTVHSTVQDAIDNPAFSDFGRLLFPVDLPVQADWKLGDVTGRFPWYSCIRPQRTVSIINELVGRAEQGETIFYDIYTEAEYNKFSLIQPFPFKAYTDMNKTLEEEHLVPNAVLQIKEEDE